MALNFANSFPISHFGRGNLRSAINRNEVILTPIAAPLRNNLSELSGGKEESSMAECV